MLPNTPALTSNVQRRSMPDISREVGISCLRTVYGIWRPRAINSFHKIVRRHVCPMKQPMLSAIWLVSFMLTRLLVFLLHAKYDSYVCRTGLCSCHPEAQLHIQVMTQDD